MKKYYFAILICLFFISGCEEENVESYTFSDLTKELTAFRKDTKVLKKASEYVGAEDGYWYTVGDCTIEVYKYDKNSEAYKTAEANQQIYFSLLQQKFDGVVKNGYAYYVNEGNCNEVIPFVEKLMNQ